MRIAAVVVTLAIGTAHADNRSPEDTAAEYVDAAQAAQRNSDFDTAIDLYQKAFDLTKHPLMLWNMAYAHRLASAALHDKDRPRASQHRDAAREMYRRFIETRPAEDMELQARGWLDKLDKQWAEENPAEEAARRLEEQRVREEAVKKELARLAEEKRKRDERDAIERAHLAADKGRIARYAGLGAMGAGAIAAGVGVYFGVRAHGIGSDLHRDDVFDPKRIDDGESAERAMTVSYIAGGVLLVGGAVTYYLGRRIGERAVLAPTAGGGAVVLVRGAW